MTLVLNGTTGISAVDGSAATPAIQGNDTNTGVFFPAADTVAIATGGTEAVRVDSSRNVGIGTSSPNKRLHVQNGSSGASNYGVPGLAIESSTNVDLQMMGSTTGQLGITFSDSGNNQAGFIYYQNNGDYLQIATNGAERARIDSSGNVMFNKTSTAASGSGVCFQTNDTSQFYRGGDGQALQFFRSSSQVGSISVTGTNTAFNTSSDYRLKEDIAPMTGALAKVSLLKPRTYKWKLDGSAGEGFIAHELAEVVPGCVTGEKDAVDADGSPVYQGIDTSFLVATLTAAIQEQQAMIVALKAEVDALKGAQA